MLHRRCNEKCPPPRTPVSLLSGRMNSRMHSNIAAPEQTSHQSRLTGSIKSAVARRNSGVVRNDTQRVISNQFLDPELASVRKTIGNMSTIPVRGPINERQITILKQI